MRNRQSGSAHVIIIIVLIVALLGALGFVFYQNFIAKKATTPITSTSKSADSKSTETTSPKKTVKALAMNTIFTNGLSLEYPAAWTVEHQPVQGTNPPSEDGTTSDQYILTSPDGKIDLRVEQNAGGGVGGSCMPEEVSTLATYSYEGSQKWATKSYADYIFSLDNTWVVGQGLGDLSAASAIKAGDSRCDVGFLFIADTGKKVGSTNAIRLFTSVRNHGSTSSFSFNSLADAKTYLNSQNAKDVKSILLSLK